MSQYIMVYKYINCTRDFFFFFGGGGVFNKKINPLALVGYEMIIASSTLCTLLAIFHLMSETHSVG